MRYIPSTRRAGAYTTFMNIGNSMIHSRTRFLGNQMK